MKPQCARLLALLEAAGDEGVTSLQAQYAGCGSRASARVQDLEELGYRITSELVQVETSTGTARVSRYRLVRPVVAAPIRGTQDQLPI